MALFKVYRGNETNLPATKSDGWAYFCTDTGNFYIDWMSDEGLLRTQVNANYANFADNLRYVDGDEYAEIDATTIVRGLTTIWTDVQSLKNDKVDTSTFESSIAEVHSFADQKTQVQIITWEADD